MRTPLIKGLTVVIFVQQGTLLDLEDGPASADLDDEQRSSLTAILSNSRLSERYLALARDLDLMAPRLPEEVNAIAAVPATQTC